MSAAAERRNAMIGKSMITSSNMYRTVAIVHFSACNVSVTDFKCLDIYKDFEQHCLGPDPTISI